MKSSLTKNFAIAFYRYRMWLEEQQVEVSSKRVLLRDTNHFLAYLTFSETDFRAVFKKEELLKQGLRNYKRFLRSSMGLSDRNAASMLSSVKHFCQFNALSALASAQKPLDEVQIGSAIPVDETSKSSVQRLSHIPHLL